MTEALALTDITALTMSGYESGICLTPPETTAWIAENRGRWTVLGLDLNPLPRLGHYDLKGVKCPCEWFLDPTALTPQIALKLRNMEQRRVACELLGWRRVLEAVNAVVVDADPDPEIGTLIRVDLPDAPGEQFIRVQCGTSREFVLPVPRSVKTAQEAQDWMWSVEPGEYAPEVRT